MEDKEIVTGNWKDNIKTPSSWTRIFYIILFVIVMKVLRWIIFGITLFQFIHNLISGYPNQRCKNFSSGLAKYIHNIVLYLNYNTNEKPYPFNKWNEFSQED